MRLPYKNETVFAGYVGNVPEARTLASGDVTVSLRIVSKHSWLSDGKWQTQDEWATAVFYRALAESVIAHGIGRGSFVHVEGRRHTRRWGEDVGKPKVSHEIIVTDWHEVTLPAGAKQTPQPAEAPAEAAAPKPARAAKLQERKPTPPPSSATEAFA